MYFLKRVLTLVLIIHVPKVLLDSSDCPDIKNLRVGTYVKPQDLIFTTVNDCIGDTLVLNFTHMDLVCRNQSIITKLRAHYVRNIPELTFLNVEECPITDIEPFAFTNLPKLTYLRLTNPERATLTILRRNIFNAIPSLEFAHLQLGAAYIEEEAFADLPNLRFLDLSFNRLTYLYSSWFTNSTKIEYLWLNNNKLAEIGPGVFKVLVNLQFLKLDNNQIVNISSNAFEGLTGLFELTLSNNKITTLSGDILPVTKRFKGIGKIYLDRNELNYLTEDFLGRTLYHGTSLIAGGNPLACSCLSYIYRWMNRNFIKPGMFELKITSTPIYGECALGSLPDCVADRESPNECDMTVKPDLAKYYKFKASGVLQHCYQPDY